MFGAEHGLLSTQCAEVELLCLGKVALGAEETRKVIEAHECVSVLRAELCHAPLQHAPVERLRFVVPSLCLEERSEVVCGPKCISVLGAKLLLIALKGAEVKRLRLVEHAADVQEVGKVADAVKRIGVLCAQLGLAGLRNTQEAAFPVGGHVSEGAIFILTTDRPNVAAAGSCPSVRGAPPRTLR